MMTTQQMALICWMSSSCFLGSRAFRPSKLSPKVQRMQMAHAVTTTSTKSSAADMATARTTHRVRWNTVNGDANNTSSIGESRVFEFDAFDGELLRTAALRSGVISPHNGRSNFINCRGLGTCGTCAVAIVATHGSDSSSNNPVQGAPTATGAEGRTELAFIEPKERNTVESIRLSVPPGHGPTSAKHRYLRLACQVQIRGGVTVTKYAGFWGQYIDQVAPGSIPTQPLGSWEFILDTTSPKRNGCPNDDERADTSPH